MLQDTCIAYCIHDGYLLYSLVPFRSFFLVFRPPFFFVPFFLVFFPFFIHSFLLFPSFSFFWCIFSNSFFFPFILSPSFPSSVVTSLILPSFSAPSFWCFLADSPFLFLFPSFWSFFSNSPFLPSFSSSSIPSPFSFRSSAPDFFSLILPSFSPLLLLPDVSSSILTLSSLRLSSPSESVLSPSSPCF